MKRIKLFNPRSSISKEQNGKLIFLFIVFSWVFIWDPLLDSFAMIDKWKYFVT